MTNPDTPPDRPDLDDVLFEQAVSAHEAGQFEEADRLYRMVLAQSPDDAVALELLGQVSLSCGRAEEAVEQLARSVEVDPACASAWFAYASALDSCDRAGEAEAAALRAIGIDPYLAGVRAVLAGLLLRRGEVEQGTAEVERVLEVPRPAPIELRAVARAAWAAGELRLAARCMMRLEYPEDADLAQMFELSGVLFGGGDLASMDALLRHLHRCRPGHVETARNLAAHLANRRREHEAVEVLRQALAEQAESSDLRIDLADLLDRLGDHESARREASIAARHGGGWRLRWRGAARCLKPSYSSEAEILECRAMLEESLVDAKESLELSTDQARADACEAVMSTSFFLLPAQGLCDREPAARIGQVIGQVAQSIDASLASDPPEPRIAADGRLRIGLLSGFFRSHSNWKSHLAWLLRLDPSRFEVIGFSTQSSKGPELEEAKSRLARMEVVTSDPIGLARRVREERLHAVILPEIGMDPMIRIAAAARLAPIQWCSWGHATTSGYASVNGYISGAFMEPDDADAHYTEPLIRLPGVGCSFVRPGSAPSPVHRSELGVGSGEVAIWCAHAPFTHLPQHDSVLTRIAERSPSARFVFVAMEPGDPVRNRIDAAFRARGLDPDRHLRFLPRMPISQFLGANAACDFYLDTPEWSGCNTGLETILMGCPPITLPGRFMRGRHLWAFLHRMQMRELAAWSVDEYVELAVRMIGDAGMRRAAAKTIAERRDVLFEDPTPRVAFEELLEQACLRL